jgi:hypothetical protein
VPDPVGAKDYLQAFSANRLLIALASSDSMLWLTDLGFDGMIVVAGGLVPSAPSPLRQMNQFPRQLP